MTEQPMFARPFVLQRDHDVSGVSGTGTVADGVQFPDGSVAIRWRGARPSTVVWASLADALHVHGHSGATRVVWSGQQLAGPACACAHPRDEHTVYGCADGCACEWLPKRAAAALTNR